MIDFQDRETMNHASSDEARHGVRQIAHDVVTLLELQAALLHVDSQKWVRSSIVPAVALAVVAGIAAVASLPLLLLSLAYYLAEANHWTLASSLVASGGAGLAVASLAGLGAWSAFRRGRGAFQRFRDELQHNITWLKQVLGRPVETADLLTPDAARWPPR
jgi:hypothetical protein